MTKKRKKRKRRKREKRENDEKEKTKKRKKKKGKTLFSWYLLGTFLKVHVKLKAWVPYWKHRMDRLRLACAAPLAPITLPTGQAEQPEASHTMEELQEWVEELMRYMERSMNHGTAIDGSMVEDGMIRVMEEIILKDAERTANEAVEFVLQDE